MNIKQIKKLLVTIVFSIALTVFSGGNSYSEEANPLKETIERTEELILTSHILSEEEGKELSQLLSRISDEAKDLQLLKETSLGTTQKVVKDRANLQFLLVDLNKLAKDKYSSKIGRIKSSNLKNCWSELKKLAAGMERQRPKINKPKDPLNDADYRMIMNQNSVFLTGTKKVETPLSLATVIKKQISKAYPLWDVQYAELLNSFSKDKIPEEVFNDEELKFIKVFGRVKIYYHLLFGTL